MPIKLGSNAKYAKIVIKESNISKRHLEIDINSNEKFTFRDLQSRYGTFS